MLTLEVIPNVYQLSIRAANIILIVEERLTLIDVGLYGSSTQIVDFIRHLGRSVDEIGLIIITHNHFDHMGGLAELREITRARVAAHKAGIVNTDEELPFPGGRGVGKLLRFRPFSSLRRHLALKPEDVDILLEGGEVLEPLGGLKVVHTPGHSPGSISLFSPGNKLLIVGDALVRRRKSLGLPYKMVSIDRTQAIDSVREMARLDFDILCFGHGRPLTGDAHARLLKLLEKTES